jgi:hypothetical protein
MAKTPTPRRDPATSGIENTTTRIPKHLNDRIREYAKRNGRQVEIARAEIIALGLAVVEHLEVTRRSD